MTNPIDDLKDTIAGLITDRAEARALEILAATSCDDCGRHVTSEDAHYYVNHMGIVKKICPVCNATGQGDEWEEIGGENNAEMGL